MKGKNYLFTYVSALVIGILLLIYHDKAQLYNSVVIAIGALIALPSLILLIIEVARGKRKPAEGEIITRSKRAEKAASNWATIVTGLAGLILGIWMLCSPGFFIKAIIYTLGGILILVGIVQISAIYSAARPVRPIALWFIIPVLTLIAGLVIILMGPDKVSAAAGLIAGISLVVYAANGFAAAGREAKVVADLDKAVGETPEKIESAEKSEDSESKSENTDSEAEK
ncbi:MAG: DUF308 domain-containing protein [Muribaculaceae bacterium]|nr:DUF308 domain-containing protein [Muribaculaceae bacterium]